jgi:tetratricopeptide (TPR) repeat protein
MFHTPTEPAAERLPNTPEDWNNRATMRHLGGGGAAALDDLAEALRLRPAYPEALNNRGFIRHALGDCAGAVPDFDAALSLAPRYFEALCNRARAWQAIGQPQRALADLEEALAVRPGDAEAHAAQAAVLMDLGQWEAALAAYDEVLARIPRAAAAGIYHSRGSVRVRQRKFAEALAEFNTVLEIAPTMCLGYVSRGNVRYHLRDPDAARDYWTAMQLDPELAATDIARFIIDDAGNDAEEVLKNCRQHLRIWPLDVVARARRALTLLVLDRPDEAALDFERIVALLPQWAPFLQRLLDAVSVRAKATLYPGR